MAESYMPTCRYCKHPCHPDYRPYRVVQGRAICEDCWTRPAHDVWTRDWKPTPATTTEASREA